MKETLIKIMLSVFSAIIFVGGVAAQCSICTKTASQLGKDSAEGLNSGIVYLMVAPFAIAGYIGYKWWKQEGSDAEHE